MMRLKNPGLRACKCVLEGWVILTGCRKCGVSTADLKGFQAFSSPAIQRQQCGRTNIPAQQHSPRACTGEHLPLATSISMADIGVGYIHVAPLHKCRKCTRTP